MKKIFLFCIAVAFAMLGILSAAAEPDKPMCKVGERYDAKIKRCVSG